MYDYCNRLSLNFFHYGFILVLTNIEVEETVLKFNWALWDDTSIVLQGETTWTRMDGQEWSPELYLN